MKLSLSERPLDRKDVFAVVQWQARKTGIKTKIGCHTFRATGITIYLINGGDLEKAQQMEWRPHPGPALLSEGGQRTLRVRRIAWSRSNSLLAACVPSRSWRNSSMRAHMVAKSSAARGRFTFASLILVHCGFVARGSTRCRHEGPGRSNARATRREACRDAGKTVSISVAVPLTAGFDRLFPATKAICRCPNRSKGRSWPQNCRESGECRLIFNQWREEQMTSDKAQRDALNNQRFKDIYIHASQEPWIEFYPGIGFKLLRATQETGHWTVLLNCAKGSSIPRHEHLGAGEYFVISGKMEVRGGVENGGITAIAGDYGYEPNGVIHDMTNFPEDTILYFTNFGPIRYIDDDNNTVGFLDWQGVLRAAEEGAAKIAS
jgi:quercetin dioxygenase-like cupin family protein